MCSLNYVGDAVRGDRFDRRRGESGRAVPRGRRDAIVGVKRKPIDDWPLRGERSRPSPKFPRPGMLDYPQIEY